MIFTVLTLFPAIFDSPVRESLLGKAVDRGIIQITTINIRDFATDIHKTCDDAPYGGGPGMVMKIEPVCNALRHVEQTSGPVKSILLTPQGRVFDQETAVRFSRLSHICLLCGRYEGIDERVLQYVDEEISVGDFVLSGGEIPALVLIDAVTRLIPGFMGNDQSVHEESLSEHLLEYPQYTRPPVFEDMGVPPVLLSGNHEEIRRWRRKESLRKTMLKRPDLMERFTPSREDEKLLKEILNDFPE